MDNIRSFLEKNSPWDGKEWKIVQTCSRCAGFNLAYGCLYKIRGLLDQEIKNWFLAELEEGKIHLSTEEWEAIGQDNEKFRKEVYSEHTDNVASDFISELQLKYPKLTFYLLPCCWRQECEYDLFVGFNVYPLLWSETNRKLQSKKWNSGLNILDSQINKTSTEKDTNHRPKYKLPKFLKEIVHNMNDTYCDLPTWEDCLYFTNYNLDDWISILDNLYHPKIQIIQQELLNITEFNTINSQCKWCLLPTDCAACS